ncbi:hypothetical protein E2C01_040007 [Portunus trituberculatus]|uniref:Reverse transcriptase RNase H-like domain-containing protein n=1 Tax=Portunus trituberculatus TaxID=210409 RepID=A0A5B7FG91_PORTR|nr:hypothetical protein [Portunus trituberculatus]
MFPGISNLTSAKFALPRRTDQVLGALAGLSRAATQRGLDCLGALTGANLDIMQPYEMLRLRMMLRRQAVIAHGLTSTARGIRARTGCAVGSDTLLLLRFRPLLLLREAAERRPAPFMVAPPEQILFSDASQLGWVAHLGDSLASEVWTLEEQGLHINNLKFLAVFRPLQSFQQAFSGSVVFVMSDNLTVVTYLKKSRGAHSKPLSALAGMVLRWLVGFMACQLRLDVHDLFLRPRFPG